MKTVVPSESDYPDELFRTHLCEYRVTCPLECFRLNGLVRHIYWRRVETAFELVPRQHWGRVLDLGTGMGVFVPELSSMAREVVGVDLSRVLHYTQTMLDKRGIANASLQFADALHLPFARGAFDLIVCMSMIEHIPDPADALAEMSRVLGDGGVLVIGYPLEHDLFHFFKWLGILLPGRVKHRMGIGYTPTGGEPFHLHASDYRSIDRSCERAFQVDARRTVGFMGIPLYRVQRLVK